MIKKIRGFTLIELMITLMIIAILASIGTVTYFSKVKSGRRTDGIDAILSITLAQERYRSSNTTYGTLAQVWNGTTTSPQGFYTLAISNVSATSYTVTATAVGNQSSDSDSGTSCSSLVYTYSNGTGTQTPTACWPS